jgi:hypothetical protein
MRSFAGSPVNIECTPKFNVDALIQIPEHIQGERSYTCAAAGQLKFSFQTKISSQT